ncbi:MAG TPA: methylated-DNA--[protein]-cysteine S-methyltransferase [Gaiellaceae bacterium]|nr:methylated-DNA--[protein]-cysteine S-methyltransferase [Gaiellaceae bacterium]
MRPTCVRYEAPGWGVGELWLDGARVIWSEHPRPERTMEGSDPRHEGSDPSTVLAGRLRAFFAGGADDFADVELDVDDGFYGDCARALRAVPRGEVVTYGELAALAGRPGAARAAGTFCARNRLGVFVPCHRVVAAGGIGTFGDLGVAYKRRMLALEGVVL